MEIKAQLEEENGALEADIKDYKEAREKVEPVIQQLEEETLGLMKSINKLNQENSVLRDEIKGTKDNIQEYTDKLANDKFLVLNAQQENEKLKSQVVRSPEKLKRALTTMDEDVVARKEDVEQLAAKLRELQSRHLALEKLDNKLAKRVAEIGECANDKTRIADIHKESKAKLAAVSREEDSVRELTAAAEHLQRQVNNNQDKLFQLQKTSEQKRYAAQQALDETERKKMELSYSIQQDRSQLDSNQAIIQRKQQEHQWLKSEHDREMSVLRERYSNFADQLKKYHSSLLSAMS